MSGALDPRPASAVEFAEIGCRIVPAAGKNPGGYLGTGWPHKATRDPDLIAAWWEAWSGANVAVIPDRALLPVDVDDPASFAGFEGAHGPAPRTPRYLSGGDGGRERLLFAYPGDEQLDGVNRMLAPGVQLRHSATTSLVCIVPPGLNPDTGRELEWVTRLDEAPLAQIPRACLPSPNAGPGAAQATGQPASGWVAAFCRDYTQGCGETHPATMSMAAYLVQRLGSGRVALELLLAWNQRRCKPPKPEREIIEQVRWAARKEAQL